jgi:hypothetical protein
MLETNAGLMLRIMLQTNAAHGGDTAPEGLCRDGDMGGDTAQGRT